jgi:streptomycin 6-kinase
LALQRAGDLRHENILWDALAQEWRPIDPNGGFGEPEVDAVAWLRSPFVQFGTVAEILRLTEGRFVRMEAELGWSRERGVDLAVAGLDELLDEVEEGHPWHRYAEAVRSI